MQDIIQVKDKRFSLSITEQQILAAIDKVAEKMNHDLEGKNPIFLAVLNGSFMFVSDLMKRVLVPGEISFVKLSSYSGMATTGQVKQLIGLNSNIEGRTVVVLEDIVDSGITMHNLLAQLTERGAKEVKVATLLSKPAARKVEVPLDYIAIEIGNDFIVGYGLDYDGYGRNLPHIYKVSE